MSTTHVMKVSSNGQASIPAVRARSKADRVVVVDLGDRVVLRPLPEHPLADLQAKHRGREPGSEPAADAVTHLLAGDGQPVVTPLSLAEVADHLVRLAGADGDETVLDLARLARRVWTLELRCALVCSPPVTTAWSTVRSALPAASRSGQPDQ